MSNEKNDLNKQTINDATIQDLENKLFEGELSEHKNLRGLKCAVKVKEEDTNW